MNFIVTSRQTIERGIVVRTPYVVISLRDPGTPHPRIRNTPGRRGTLSLEFHDAEPVRNLVLPPEIRLMTRADAEAIWQFVQQHHAAVETIVCHCEQGMSRSPAIAVALAESLGGDAGAIRLESQPNAFVYRLLRDTIHSLQAPSFHD